ncbi:MAG: ABC transporter permease [Deltaproteobacteria bacterium]|nr:ABC transporter permease [Deltaproteobacteria bacterium]
MMIIKLAWRSLWRNRRRTVITICSISLGTALTIFLISMQEGIYKKLVDDVVRMNAGYVTVENRKYAEAPSIDLVVPSVNEVRRFSQGIPGVKAIKALILGQAMAATGSGSVGIGLVGVEPEVEMEMSPLVNAIRQGRYLRGDDDRGVIIGSILADRLDLEPGMKLVVTSNDSSGELVNELLRVKGIFSTGMEEADGYLAQVPIDVARRIFHLGSDEATQVGLMLTSPDYEHEAMEKLNEHLAGSGLYAFPWQDIMPDLAGFIAADKVSLYVFQGIIIFLLSFTILNTILMSVLERNREFATLLALGTSPRLLRTQIVIESIMLAFLGTGFGLAIGGSISMYYGIHGLDMRSLLGEDFTISGFLVDPVVYNYVGIDLLALLGGLVFVLTVLIGLYPAYKSTRISLPDVLRSR